MSASPAARPVVELAASDLPAFCPNPSMPLWAAHPRIFLDVVNESEAVCTYCGMRYRRKQGAHVRDHEFGTHNLHQHREQHAVQLVTARMRPRVRVEREQTP